MPEHGTTDLLTQLRSLDPAASVGSIDPTGPRARAALERILASAPGTPARSDQPATPRRSARRLLVAAGAVVALAVAGALALPSLTGGDRAFATWEPRGHALSAAEQHAATEDCRSAQLDGPGADYDADLDAARPVLAETRGAWTTVILSGAGGFSALCVTDRSTHVFDDWFGSVGTPSFDTTPGPRELIATDLGTGAIDAGELSLAAGTAGREVTAVSYDSATHGTVHATLAAGHFALWLPGGDFVDAASSGIEVRVTLADGTTRLQRLSL